jgi:inner membrane protein
VRTSDQGPGGIAWCIATVSLVLPWVGLGLCLVGGAQVYRGGSLGWWLVAAGVAILVLDIAIDFVWAHPSVSLSDQPDLNRRAAQYVGRVFVVEEPIVAGRGKVRIGDTLWPVEGPDTAIGARVKVTAVRGTVLVVEGAATEA